jgi:hypothetical protein
MSVEQITGTYKFRPLNTGDVINNVTEMLAKYNNNIQSMIGM